MRRIPKTHECLPGGKCVGEGWVVCLVDPVNMDVVILEFGTDRQRAEYRLKYEQNIGKVGFVQELKHDA